MAQTTFTSLDEVPAAVGRQLGTTGWLPVTRAQVEDFERATGQPSGGSTVPALLILSLTNLFLPEIVEVRGAAMGVNYGTGEVRFGPEVPIGARIRARADLVACDEVRGGIQTTMRIVVEVAGRDEPACIVAALSRWLR